MRALSRTCLRVSQRACFLRAVRARLCGCGVMWCVSCGVVAVGVVVVVVAVVGVDAAFSVAAVATNVCVAAAVVVQ
eukprot:15017118-Alexandrium_andersonii.AAC.1